MKAAEVKARTRTELGGQAVFDPNLYDQVLDAILRLAPAWYAQLSTPVHNPPTLEDRLKIAAGVRALGNSQLLHYLVPSGVESARLYYLVAFMEGVIMPHIQVLIQLCEQDGNVGPVGKKGKTELELSRGRLSTACRFLATTGAPSIVGEPLLLEELRWLTDNKIPQLRNAIAHFKFRLVEPTVPPTSIASFQALGRLGPIGLSMLKSLAELLGIPGYDANAVPDYENSYIQYEENFNKPLTPSSRKRSYPELGAIVERVERLGFAMLLAMQGAGVVHQNSGDVRLGGCTGCGQGVRAGVPGAAVTCPSCGKTWSFA